MPQLNIPDVGNGSVSMYVESHGDGATPIVLVHGFACDHSDWAHQTEGLAARFRTLSCDLVGHGQSSGPGAEGRVETLGHHVAHLLDVLDLTGAYLVGHSMGCRVVLQACLDNPERVKGAVLVDGSWIGNGDPEQLEADAIAAFENTGFTAMVETLFQQMFLDGADPQVVARFVERAKAMDPGFATRLFASLVAWDARHMERVLPAVDAQLLVIQSTFLNAARERVPLEPGQSTPWLDLVRESRPDAQIETVPKVGHFPMLEAPDVVNRLIASLAGS